MFRKKKEIEIVPVKTVFNVPSEEAKIYLSSIVKDVNEILNNDKFMEATKRVKLPENATIKDYEQLVKKTVPTKIYNFLMLFIDDCYDNVRRILASIYVTDFEVYKNKSLKEMSEDIARLSQSELGQILSFFRR